MRVLVVVSGNHGQVAPFVVEQAEALQQAGCEVQLFVVEGHGAKGYLRNLRPLKHRIQDFHPDVVHAHYGLCGLLCTLQHKVPVVVTYHGSDINNRRILPLSRIAMRRAAHNIFVSKKLQEKSLEVLKSRYFEAFSSVIPCGIDTSVFHPMNREEACQIVGLDPVKHYVLFAGAFDNEIKNPLLAQNACSTIPKITLLELKGYNRTEVAALMNSADCLLMTSHSEGSPQVVKEALSCGCPIVSVDVGDVREIIDGTDCGVIVGRNPEAISKALSEQLTATHRTNGKKKAVQFDNRHTVLKIIEIYKKYNIKDNYL